MARKRIHGRKKRSPVRTSMYIPPGGSAVDPMTGQTMSRPMQNPIGQIGGEDYTNYSPEQMQQMQMQGAEQMKRAQFEQQRMLQQQRRIQNPQQGGKDGAHGHRERTSGLGGMIKSAATHARRKGGQSPSPYNSPYNTEEF